MKTSDNTKNLNLALFKFQGIMPKIKRNAKNSHFKSTYITWDDLADAVIPRLQECGLYFEQEDGQVDGYVTVSTRITHAESGEYKQYAPYRIKESSSGNQDHNTGKSTTYAQKRSLVLALGIRGTDEDTDGNEPCKQTIYTQDSSPRYEPKKDYSKALDVWIQSSDENIRSEKPTSINRKREEKEWRNKHIRFMIWFKDKGITNEVRLDIIKRVTGKTSSKQLTIDEMRNVCRSFLVEQSEAV